MSQSRSVQLLDILLFAGLGILSFLPFLGLAPLFDWDEINFAESAREMIQTGNYFQVQINFEPFWEKPPLFLWLQVLSMKLFGVNEFAARFPNAIVGIFTLLSLYIHGTRLQGNTFGRLVAGFYFVSILPHLYFKSGIIDPTFNFFIFLSLIHIVKYEVLAATLENPRRQRALPWLAGYWAGMATLTKGPVALIVIFAVFFIYKVLYAGNRRPWIAILKFTTIYLFVIASWFGSIIVFTEEGMDMVRKFIEYQAELFSQPVAGHQQPFYYHFVVFLIGCFPLSAFAFRGMFLRHEDFTARVVKRYMFIWFWLVLVLFSIVQPKIVHYSSLLYFPGAFLAAAYFKEMIDGNKKMKWDNYLVYGIGILVYGVALSLISVVTNRLDEIVASTDDPFTKANLAADAGWTGWEFLPGLFFALALIFGLYLLIRKRFRAFIAIHLLATPIFLNSLNAMIVPKVAEYTQMAAVDFFKSKADEECYLMVEGYKSYAHYFYGQVKPFPYPEIPRDKRGDWLARGEIDKPVYLVTRIDRATEEFENVWFVNFKKLYEKNGFVFYLRESPSRSPSSKGPV